jgi:hypothetical protein
MFTGKWQRLCLVCILAAVQYRSIKVCTVILLMLEWSSETIRHCAFTCNPICDMWAFACSSSYSFIKCLVPWCFSTKFIVSWHIIVCFANLRVRARTHARGRAHTHTVIVIDTLYMLWTFFVFCNYRKGSIFGIVTSLQTGRSGFQSPAGAKYIYRLQNVQTTFLFSGYRGIFSQD